MTIELSLWWIIPALITVLGIVWALCIHDDGTSGFLSGLGNLLMLIPVLGASLVAWIIAAVLK